MPVAKRLYVKQNCLLRENRDDSKLEFGGCTQATSNQFIKQNPRIPQLSRCQDFSVLTTALSNVELQQCRAARDFRGSSLSPGLIHLENV